MKKAKKLARCILKAALGALIAARAAATVVVAGPITPDNYRAAAQTASPVQGAVAANTITRKN